MSLYKREKAGDVISLRATSLRPTSLRPLILTVKDIIFKSPMKGIQDITLVNVKCEPVTSFPT